MHAEMCIYIFLVCPSEMHIVILYHEMRERKRKKKKKTKKKTKEEREMQEDEERNFKETF